MRPALLTAILAAIAMPGCEGRPAVAEFEACLDVPEDATSCPAPDQVPVADLRNYDWCATEVSAVTGQGVLGSKASMWDTGGIVVCCYPALGRNGDSGCAVGRPYVEDGRGVVASLRRGLPEAMPNADLADEWLRAALMEHASVAAFARLTLELMALGAPIELLAQVQQAAADEVEHARLCFDLASRFAGQEITPGPLRFEAPVLPSGDPVVIATAAVREGCFGETIGAWLAARAAGGADHPDIARALTRIADDETRHAALSWRIVAYLLREGGAEVRQAVEAAFAEPYGITGGLGTTDRAELATLCEAVAVEVLRPAARALLAV